MENNGINGDAVKTAGFKSLVWKLLAASLVVALVLGALPMQALAQDDTLGSSSMEQDWAHLRSKLASETAFYNNFRTKPGQYGNNAQVSLYLDRFAAAMRGAQTLIAGDSGFNAVGQITNQNQANRSIKQLKAYLATMRGMRSKLSDGTGDTARNTGNNNNSNNLGIPVTGENATAFNSNQNQNAGQGNSLANKWGRQLRELQAATAWYNNYRTKPGETRSDNEQARIQRYLDRYAFALQQANSVIVNGGLRAEDGTSIGRGTPQQQLASFLGMMRALRQKITNGGDRDTANNNGTSTNDQQNP